MNRASIIAAVYLVTCLTFGGSGQGIFSNLFLQAAAVLILAWLTWHPARLSRPDSMASLRLIIAAGIFWSVFQLVPLPPAVWAELSGRSLVAQAYRLTGEPLPWLPLSLTPDATIACLLSLLPASALGALVVRRDDVRVDLLAIALLTVMTVGILLEIVQLGGGEEYYLYPVSNFGAAAGFFANSNHMAALILVAIPFLAALASRYFATKRSRSERLAGYALIALMTFMLLTGIASNGSFAILLLGAPVVVASAFLLIPPGKMRIGRMVAMTGILAFIGAAALVVMAWTGLSVGNSSSVTIRKEIWEHSLALIGQYGLVGTGLGSFAQVYPLSEDPMKVEWVFINHAHNDFLELILELGLPGVVLIMVFLFWWLKRTIALWRTREPTRFARAATIASGALLLHSLVDYPMRNAALSSVFGMAIAMMVIGGRSWRAGPAHGTAARHLSLKDLG